MLTERAGLWGAALVAALLSCGAVEAQTAQKPSPPSQICVNDKCVATPSAAAAGTIKWNPGHYMASYSIVKRGGQVDQSELNDVLNAPAQIVGFRVFFNWDALESDTQGAYTFSYLDSLIAQLKAKNKRLVLVVLPGFFSGFRPPPIPRYILTSSAYGPAPSGSWDGLNYGWWGSSSYASGASLQRTAVNERWIALHQALGARYDNEPYFEAIMLQETSWIEGTQVGAPDLDNAAWLANRESMLEATLTAFPTTNVVEENSWTGTATLTQQEENWMSQHRVAAGNADTWGQSYISASGIAQALPWGIAAYLGVQAPGSSITSSDMRSSIPYMADVEGPDIGATYNGTVNIPGGTWTPQDVLNALNQTYRATHAFWTRIVPSENTGAPAATMWSNLLPFLESNPLLNTAYPKSYQ